MCLQSLLLSKMSAVFVLFPYFCNIYLNIILTVLQSVMFSSVFLDKIFFVLQACCIGNPANCHWFDQSA